MANQGYKMFFVNEMGIAEEAKLQMRLEQNKKSPLKKRKELIDEEYSGKEEKGVIIINPKFIAKLLREAKDDRQKAIEFIKQYKKYATFPDDSLGVKPYLGENIAMAICALKKKHKID